MANSLNMEIVQMLITFSTLKVDPKRIETYCKGFHVHQSCRSNHYCHHTDPSSQRRVYYHTGISHRDSSVH